MHIMRMLGYCPALTPTTPLRCSCIFIRREELGDAAARCLMEVDLPLEVKQAPSAPVRNQSFPSPRQTAYQANELCLPGSAG